MLEIVNLSKKYKNKMVLNDISMKFENATSTIIVGESGSGKTTLAKIIIGLEIQEEGKIIFDNKILKQLSKRDYKLCSQIQYIFQDPYSALEQEDTIKNTLEEPRRIALRKGHNPMEINEVLELVDETMLDYLNQKVKVLSGGQMQKLCIARALISKPRLIIADECTAMLDKSSGKSIDQLLLNLVKKESICLIYITHEVDFKKGEWDNISVFKEGHLVEIGKFKNFANQCKEEYSKAIVEATVAL